MEERQLIEGCLRGESWAQKRIYELHAPAMMSVCQRYVPCRETAQDLLHDGFIKLFSKINSYSGTGSFNGWMRKIFVTTALDYLRHNDVLKNSVELEKVDAQEDVQDISVFERLSIEVLFECIANLPDANRTVFNMHAIEGYSHSEIAKELGISESAAKSRYAKARQFLQKIVSLKFEVDSFTK